MEVAGGEAAPYEVFVGNTNPGSTPDIIGDVLKKCAEMLPPDQQLSEPLQVLQVKCLTRPNDSGEPLRTKCWMVQVPNKYREHMLKDDPGKNPGASVEELRDQRSLEDIQARGAVQGVMPGREARACSPVYS